MITIETVKNIAACFGCAISGITLVGIFIKPIRKWAANIILRLTHTDQIKLQEIKLAEEDEKINKLTEICERNEQSIQELKQTIDENKADDLRGELFNCGNRCRRGIPLSYDEFRYIQTVWQKYSEKLHQNSIGEDEYYFIVRYYESKENQNAINKTAV